MHTTKEPVSLRGPFRYTVDDINTLPRQGQWAAVILAKRIPDGHHQPLKYLHTHDVNAYIKASMSDRPPPPDWAELYYVLADDETDAFRIACRLYHQRPNQPADYELPHPEMGDLDESCPHCGVRSLA